MATINATTIAGEAQLTTWSGLATGDDGAPAGSLGSGDRTFGAFGTFGGATVTLQGSLDGENNWRPLTDPLGVVIALTAPGLRAVLESTQFVRPVVTGGAANLTAQISIRRS
jgi:hypothetical protein